MDIVEKLKNDILEREEGLSKYARKSKDAIRLKEEIEDIRPAFFHDIDTIIHSEAYTRYIGKTQVFSFIDNDHVSKRMVHVQLVSKIARTIGRCLNLNEDLIEAASLGHDIGHTPIGHVGERILNDISLDEINRPFLHNMQSVRTFMEIYNKNLTIEVLDGIMCHNGEMLSNVYEPQKKTKEDFLKDYERASNDANYAKTIRPMTLEGCVVRISDVIAYIGRDIEDAITIGRLNREDVPENVREVLGDTNAKIVNTLILDIVENSYNKNKIIISDKVFGALKELMKFNYEKIYIKANTVESLKKYEEGMNKLFYKYLNDLKNHNRRSLIYKVFLDKINNIKYFENSDKHIVIDFLAGMTDEYFVKQIDKVNKEESVNKKLLTE